MADKEKNAITSGDEEGMVVVMTDADGNEYYYEEELIIPVGDDKYALLVGLQNETEDGHPHSCGCGCNHSDEEDVIIAKIVRNEAGEEEYIEPTDEEFEAVQQAYNELVEESEEEGSL